MPPLLRHLRSLALAAVLATLVAPGAAYGAGMQAPLGTRPKDFAFVKKDGVYHLFYIRHNDFLPPWATEIDFGHATSTDLYHWKQHVPVLGLNPQGWDNFHVWAPHIVEANGLWWMFYTGVSDFPGQYHATQRIGVAVSSDLFTWNRIHAAPVWSSQAAPWAWWAPLYGAMACRDAFVMPDPAAPGQWLMYYTASPASDSLVTIVGVARSPAGDPAVWQDEKPLWVTHHSLTFNTVTESPHLFEHDGTWFLFITSNAGQPLTFFTSRDPLGEPPAWRYRGRLRNMLGYDTGTWFASEALRDGDHDLFAFAAFDRIEIRRIVWATGDTFSLAEPSLFHMIGMDWTRPTTLEHQYVGLELRSTNGEAFAGDLVAWVRDSTGAQAPAPLDALGLAHVTELPSDSVLVPWFARRWPPSLPPNRSMHLRIAMGDGTASTPWLTVYPNAIEPPLAEGPGGTGPDTRQDAYADSTTTPEDPVEPVATGPPAGMPAPSDLGPRVLRGSPLGTGPAITFRLATPGHVRVELYDLQGRRLSSLADRTFAAGDHVVPWDGRDAAGVRAKRGLYFVRIVTPAGAAGAKLFLDR